MSILEILKGKVSDFRDELFLESFDRIRTNYERGNRERQNVILDGLEQLARDSNSHYQIALRFDPEIAKGLK